MSKFKSTPGPYKTIQYGKSLITIESVAGEAVCDVWFPNNQKSQANIKMIMAMDEMRDALIEVIENADKMLAWVKEKYGINDPSAEKRLERFKSIIQKATGYTWEELNTEEA